MKDKKTASTPPPVCSSVKCGCPPPVRCPPPPIKPAKLPKGAANALRAYRTPVDLLGYPRKCCWCIPHRTGVILICLISFIWALAELSRSEKKMAVIFPNKEEAYKYCKLAHMILILAYMFCCGVLFYGVVTSNMKAIHIYVWAALIFNFISIVLVCVWLGNLATRPGSVNRKITVLVVLTFLWHIIFFYYISVVNSYKYRVLTDSVFVKK